jgi:hypothetical protein
MNGTMLDMVFHEVELEYPGKFGLEDYNDARNLIIETYRDVIGLVAIYEFGKINNPGVSDLDLIFVFEDNLDNINTGLDFSERLLPVFVQNILCGSTLMVISEKNFKNILIWDDLILNRIYGKDIFINDINGEKDLRNIIQIMDWLPERILSIKKQLHVKKLPLIRFLGLLHSLNYTFDKIISGRYIPQQKIGKYIKHMESVATVRKSLLSYSDIQLKKKLASLTERAIVLGYEGMEMVAKAMKEHRHYASDEGFPLGKFQLTRDSGYKFYSMREYLRVVNSEQNIEDKTIPVPSVWKSHWKIYGEIDGPISEKIRGALSYDKNKSVEVNPKIVDFLHRRIVHCNSMADFLYRNGFPKGLYKFGWFF